MSSSQTMTAPAVGHRPSEAGPSMSSLYDYTRSQHSPENDQLPSHSPPSDSAIRHLHDSAPEHDSSPNGLPSLSGMMALKSETEDQASHAFSNGQDSQADFRRQSAASALLAQLLGGQQGNESNSSQPMEDSGMVQGQDHEQKHQFEDGLNQTWPSHLGEDVPPTIAEATLGDQNQLSESLHQPDNMSLQHSGLPFTTAEQNHNFLAKSADPLDGLTDPLLFAKPNLDHTDLFPPLDFSTAAETPLEALHQNEMLTAAYLSQSADLSALGYTEGTLHDGSGSIAGSEPRIQAFAKLEFDDGHFYCNTYSFILGRDVRAARAAHQREYHARQAMRHSRAKSSSGGNASHTPVRVKPEGNSMIGSVVSDRGGILGFDPDVPQHMQSHISRRSSASSHGDAGGLLHATPAQLQATTDYNALAMQSLQEGNADAKPVDALALLPSPDACPTIPIHPPATTDGSVAGHRGISRKHVKIAYNFDKNLFEMEVLGRNGAFIGADWLSPSQIRPLHSGDYIQIGGVRIRFLLPDVPIGETGADIEEEEFVPQSQENVDISAAAENEDDLEKKDGSKVTKIVFKNKDTEAARTAQSMEVSGDGTQAPARRRGPGRPPKDGIMSKRERAELAREQKMAAKREANGGVTPPPQSKPKAGKTTTTQGPVPKEFVEHESPNSKPEKRKYTKRKKDGTSMDFPLPSTEGGQFPPEHQPQEYVKPPPVKKRKPSRSPSPNYPPESAYTPEDLAKPPYNYAVLIFDALTEATTPMTLKQIYRALKLKYPYFRFKCETEGWTSSVRHNLNGNSHLFMHAERDGKGWSWQLRPGASVEKEKKRRPSPPPPPPQPAQAPPSVTPQYMPPPNAYNNQPNGQPGMANSHFQFSNISSNPYPPPPAATPAPPPLPPPVSQHTTPYPPPVATAPAPPTPALAPPTASSPFPIPSPIRNNLPAAFAQTTPTTYTSPYASDPPPQLLQYQQSQQSQPQAQQMQPPPPPQHQSPYPPPNSQPLPPNNHQPQNYAPNTGPPPQHQHQHQPPPPPQPHQQPYNMSSQNNAPMPMDTSSDEASFNERANKAIDDFEAVILEDYDDKDYIKSVLKSARARALGNATESSFPGGEPPDETVLLDALRNMIKGLRGE
ncbi:hypothetical protein BJY04DRAFT_233012 [Aspergillus karnatakaensis]|uniref:forkhead domain protein n=1 Tax=Aspergillus karnatakaensis TaxID=1810916 RepID=UPI003CCDABC9